MTSRKKLHHFVHDSCLDAWRVPSTIYVYDLKNNKQFEKTGRDIGAEKGFNVFGFDEKVISLLRNTFSERAERGEQGGVYHPNPEVRCNRKSNKAA